MFAASASAASAEVTVVAFATTGVTVAVADAALVDPCVATTYAETVDGSDAGGEEQGPCFLPRPRGGVGGVACRTRSVPSLVRGS